MTASVSLVPGDVLAAGRSADGTRYVLTRVADELRLFVSVDQTLIERPEAGTGEVNEGDTQTYLFDYEDEAGAPVSVQLQQTPSGSRLGVLRGPKAGDEKIWDLDTEGEELTLVDSETALELPATSTRSFFVDYEGAQSNGDLMVVLAPSHAGSYDNFRLFWGAPAQLSERKIQSVIRARSIGGPTNVTFAVDTGSAVLRYSFPYPPTADAMSTGAISIGNTSEPLTGAVPPVLPDGVQFLCR